MHVKASKVPQYIYDSGGGCCFSKGDLQVCLPQAGAISISYPIAAQVSPRLKSSLLAYPITCSLC